jgi:hypothetical protein
MVRSIAFYQKNRQGFPVDYAISNRSIVLLKPFLGGEKAI